jgi:hypothetical protein
MIAIVASRLDPEARHLAETWSAAGAVVLSAEDLGTRGWEFRPADPLGGWAVAGGRRVRTADVRAVLVRRPAVIPEELAHIEPADRRYVAAETNAFLVAWLSALTCPVVNHPTPTCLCGPAWGEWHWRSATTRVGAAYASPKGRIAVHEVVVCGSACLFARTPAEISIARALADAADVDLLSVRFQGERVCGASVAPALTHPDLRDILLDHLLARA